MGEYTPLGSCVYQIAQVTVLVLEEEQFAAGGEGG